MLISVKLKVFLVKIAACVGEGDHAIPDFGSLDLVVVLGLTYFMPGQLIN
jgi:hypothetical protein